MSLRQRLLNVARAEFSDAARRVKRSAEQLLEPHPASSQNSETHAKAREEILREEAHGAAKSSPHLDVPPEIRRFYGNLELPVGADSSEVKAAYRRLMRRYHPDKHAQDPDQARIATELSQNIRTAYDGLVAYLERSDRSD